MDAIYAERERKAKAIVDRYEDGRRYRQKDIAEELGIPLYRVSQVTRMYNHDHTKKKSNSNLNNLNEGQYINPLIYLDNLAFLDKYDISDYVPEEGR